MLVDPQITHKLIQDASLEIWNLAGGFNPSPSRYNHALKFLHSLLVMQIATQHGFEIETDAATDLACDFALKRCGDGVPPWIAAWRSGNGEAIDVNAAIALTEVIGRSADEHFGHCAAWRETALTISRRRGARTGAN